MALPKDSIDHSHLGSQNMAYGCQLLQLLWLLLGTRTQSESESIGTLGRNEACADGLFQRREQFFKRMWELRDLGHKTQGARDSGDASNHGVSFINSAPVCVRYLVVLASTYSDQP